MPLSATLIKERAEAIGFSACGITRAAAVSREREEELRAWLAAGMHGEMDYLANRLDLKLDPRRLVPGAKSVVSLAVNYFTPDEKEIHSASSEENLRLARYARGTDYHEVVKAMLRRLMVETGLAEGDDGRCFVDTAPVDEKYWAERCGLGWRGKNGQLIIPGMGSWFFLGELILTRSFDSYDSPAPNRCGSCSACLQACPSDALLGNGLMDARRCLSYLTIEYRGALPVGTGRRMTPYIYGCDRCAEACPWNNFARPTKIEALCPRPEIMAMTKDEWEDLSPADYVRLFRKSAVKRVKYEGLMRNILAVKTDNDRPTPSATEKE